MSVKYSNAHFINVDGDECQETAAAYGISAMPTFVFSVSYTNLRAHETRDHLLITRECF